MPKTACPACGADVDLARIRGTNFNVALEVFTDSASDNSFRVVNLRPLEVERVRRGTRGRFRVDHSHDCPGGNAGR